MGKARATCPRRIRSRSRARSALTCAFLAALLPAGALASEVVDVRVGRHEGYSRVVIELDQAAGYRLEHDAERGIFQVSVEASARPEILALATGAVERVEVEPAGQGARASIRLREKGARVREHLFSNPPRIVLDFRSPGDPVARSEPTVAAPARTPTAAAAPEPPAPRREPAPDSSAAAQAIPSSEARPESRELPPAPPAPGRPTEPGPVRSPVPDPGSLRGTARTWGPDALLILGAACLVLALWLVRRVRRERAAAALREAARLRARGKQSAAAPRAPAGSPEPARTTAPAKPPEPARTTAPAKPARTTAPAKPAEPKTTQSARPPEPARTPEPRRDRVAPVEEPRRPPAPLDERSPRTGPPKGATTTMTSMTREK